MNFHKIAGSINRIAGIIFINLIIFILLFVAVEMLFRHFYVDRHDVENLSWILDDEHVPKPYVMFTAKPGSDKRGNKIPENHVNSLGYLGQLPPKEKSPDAFRIFILGGSVVFDGNPSFSFLLQDVFTRHGEKNVEVYNFGIVSSVTRQELIRAQIEISTYQPDLIISYSGYNDIFNTGWDRRVNYPHRFIMFENNPFFTLRAADFPFILNILLSSEITRKLFEERIAKSIVDDHGTMPLDNDLRQLRVVQAYIQNLRMTSSVAREAGAQFMAFLQPTVYYKNPRVEAEQKIYESMQREPAALIRKTVNEEYVKFKSDFLFIDSSDIFNGQNKQVFKDSVHYKSQEDNQFVADYIYREIKKNINFSKRKKAGYTGLIPEEDFIIPGRK